MRSSADRIEVILVIHAMTGAPPTRTRRFLLVVPLGIVLLALAVFTWGLHSKLDVYQQTAHSTTSAPVAKLLSQRERPRRDLAEATTSPATTLLTASFAGALLLFPARVSAVHPREDDFCPQPQCISHEGPSSVRPPPSLV